MAILQWLAAFAATLHGAITLGALALAATAFFLSLSLRVSIDAAVAERGGQKPLGLFDLSHGDVERTLRSRRLVAPERLWTYDETYLERFAQAARHAKLPHHATALHAYTDGVLRLLDPIFALSLAAGVVLVDLYVFFAVAEAYPSWARAAWIAACMGVLYGVADVAEDRKLASLLRGAAQTNDDLVAAIDPGEAAAANLLTRIKLVTIMLSVVGALFYGALTVLGAVVVRPPADPAPQPAPARAAAD